ncbi:MAG: hypothetical protein K0Q87_4457 [Neobacillus sp.]|jgi:hypothetical protein|nr:hypothetical protein [Neobacillus sp.]
MEPSNLLKKTTIDQPNFSAPYEGVKRWARPVHHVANILNPEVD